MKQLGDAEQGKQQHCRALGESLLSHLVKPFMAKVCLCGKQAKLDLKASLDSLTSGEALLLVLFILG